MDAKVMTTSQIQAALRRDMTGREPLDEGTVEELRRELLRRDVPDDWHDRAHA